ncbi:F0F1 ATP synthase subunit delta [Bartonella australis AUST/NH1]|uniref:ATP synthase subunit delta n=1 Tax=Bartonella australis (strain Aust/NH1) TaxID=1094489 RepID=M1PEI3_BARAA|nr:ATP synthase F1 subunit delta [Bartonella australis]AGF75046.1 F0F1 ATP synthase subunit delta [Bartonella australis AUST/NH1]
MSDLLSLVPSPLVDRRYAQALFDLVQELGYIDNVEKVLAAFLVVLDQEKDLKRFVQNPFFSAQKRVEVVYSVCENIGFSDEQAGRVIRNFLRVVAVNRRFSALPGIFRAFQHCVALSRGEAVVQIISARPLNADQKEELRAALKGVVGKKILLRISVDPSILGGLIIRSGSSQVDASLVARLSSLKIALEKEVS